MYVEDECIEWKIELTRDIKKEVIAFANTESEKYTLVLMMKEILLV